MTSLLPNEIAIRLHESYLEEVSTFERRYLVMNHAEVHCDCVLTDTGKKSFLRDGNLLPVRRLGLNYLVNLTMLTVTRVSI